MEVLLRPDRFVPRGLKMPRRFQSYVLGVDVEPLIGLLRLDENILWQRHHDVRRADVPPVAVAEFPWGRSIRGLPQRGPRVHPLRNGRDLLAACLNAVVKILTP